jgi:hypothetical protein
MARAAGRVRIFLGIRTLEGPVATWPGDQGAASQGRMRASHADRDRVIAELKAAFVQGRLTKDEFDDRVGQTLAARTHAELAALTTDIPAAADVPSPRRSGSGPDRLRESKAARAAAGATVAAGLLMIAAIGNGTGNPIRVLVAALVLSPVWMPVLAGLLLLHSWLEKRAARQLPRGTGRGGQRPAIR